MKYNMVLITEGNMYRMESTEIPVLGDLEKLVGGYVTYSIGTFEGKEVWIIVDKDGTEKDLPINYMASSCAYQRLVGDALILVNFECDTVNTDSANSV